MTTSTDVAGKQLPGQPKLRAYARAEGSLFFARVVNRLTGFASLDHMSTAFFDQANLILRVPRTLVGVGAVLAFWDERLELAARVNDVFDARGQDYLGFPLPGRSFALTASLREDRP
jgi:vitamin B12 transporter